MPRKPLSEKIKVRNGIRKSFDKVEALLEQWAGRFPNQRSPQHEIHTLLARAFYIISFWSGFKDENSSSMVRYLFLSVCTTNIFTTIKIRRRALLYPFRPSLLHFRLMKSSNPDHLLFKIQSNFLSKVFLNMIFVNSCLLRIIAVRIHKNH